MMLSYLLWDKHTSLVTLSHNHLLDTDTHTLTRTHGFMHAYCQTVEALDAWLSEHKLFVILCHLALHVGTPSRYRPSIFAS